MPQVELGPYISFKYESPEEEANANTFTALNKVALQNRRFELVMQRNNLVANFEHPTEYFYQKAQLDGRIDQLTELIEFSVVPIETSDAG